MRTLHDRFIQFKNALDRLDEVIKFYKENNSQITVDAMILRFKTCTELSWKLLKDYLKYENIGEFYSPRSVVKEAYENKIIDDGELWLDMLEDRNLTSHAYDEIIVNTIRDNIINKHFNLLKKLEKEMELRINEK